MLTSQPHQLTQHNGTTKQTVYDRWHHAGINDPEVKQALDRLVVEVQARQSTVYEMLGRMDTNKDGILSRRDVGRGLTELGVRLSASELDSVMRVFDKDHSGQIDYLEFYTVLTKHRVDAATQTRAPSGPSGMLVSVQEQKRLDTQLAEAEAFAGNKSC